MNYAVDLHYDENGVDHVTLMQAFVARPPRASARRTSSAALSGPAPSRPRLSLPVLVEVMVERTATPRWACPSLHHRVRPSPNGRASTDALVLAPHGPVAELQARFGAASSTLNVAFYGNVAASRAHRDLTRRETQDPPDTAYARQCRYHCHADECTLSGSSTAVRRDRRRQALAAGCPRARSIGSRGASVDAGASPVYLAADRELTDEARVHAPCCGWVSRSRSRDRCGLVACLWLDPPSIVELTIRYAGVCTPAPVFEVRRRDLGGR